mmetsp:Transcript_58279/g.102039  ORF Transcript_58279/g.102039 Transcript_58279/m.102039 type:complete len:198 (+) Transcript_58279:110-703(+)
MGIQDTAKLGIKIPGLYIVGVCVIRKYLLHFRQVLTFLGVSESHEGFSFPGGVLLSPQQLCWGSVFICWSLAALSSQPLLVHTSLSSKAVDGRPLTKQMEELPGIRGRLWSGFLDAQEPLTSFAIAVMAGHFTAVPFARTAPLCLMFAFARCLSFIACLLGLDFGKVVCGAMSSLCTCLVFMAAVFPPLFEMTLGFQ